MFQRKQRRYRRHPSSRNHRMSHGNSSTQTRLGSNAFSNGQTRNNFRTHLSAEKLFEKYSSLAKEAMSVGDKTLCENYLQHADHFMRIIEDKNLNQNRDRPQTNSEPKISETNSTENIKINQGQEIEEKKK